MTDRWHLEMTLRGPCVEKYAATMPLDEHTARNVQKIKPLGGHFGYLPGTLSMTQAVEVLRSREFRKSLFKDAAWQLSQMLAEYMEDAEGWHDIERVEPAKASLSR